MPVIKDFKRKHQYKVNGKVHTYYVDDDNTGTGGDATVDALSIHKEWWIQFQHLSSRERVNFHGFVTQYNDTFSPDWNDEDVFGRMDPISIFKSTKRNINIAWDIPSTNQEEARMNLLTINKFAQFFYPTWQKLSTSKIPLIGVPPSASKMTLPQKIKLINAHTKKNRSITKKNAELAASNKAQYMVSSPLMRFRFANLAHNADTYERSNVINGGLVCKPNGAVTIEPDLESGFFSSEGGILYPQLWRISLGLTVFHTHTLGFSDNGEGKLTFGDNIESSGGFMSDNFPYPTK